jgi:H+/Cl- antiporter ClcA
MTFLLLLLAAYGITFGLMNQKVAFLTDWLKALRFRVETTDEESTTFFQRMLICPYCTGFHAGWLAWLLVRLPAHTGHLLNVENVVLAVTELIASAFAASAACYLLDTAAQYLEDASAAANRSNAEE